MTLQFQYTADELRDAERWLPGMGPAWRSVFTAIYLTVTLLTLGSGLSGARVDFRPDVGPANSTDVLRHLENLGLILLPMLWWLTGLAAVLVAGRTGRFSKRNRYIDDSHRVPRRSITRLLVWASFILMFASHELFTSFNPRRLQNASVGDQLRDRLPGVSLALLVSAGIWPILAANSIPKARGIRHGLGRPKQVEIDEKGIAFSDPVSMFHYPWFRITSIVETPGGYLVFDKKLAKFCRLIPRRAFLTPEQENMFRQTVFDWAAGPSNAFQVIPLPNQT